MFFCFFKMVKLPSHIAPSKRTVAKWIPRRGGEIAEMGTTTRCTRSCLASKRTHNEASRFRAVMRSGCVGLFVRQQRHCIATGADEASCSGCVGSHLL